MGDGLIEGRLLCAGRPPGVDYERLKHLFASTDSVVSVHDLNVWSLTIGRDALSVHLAVGEWAVSGIALRCLR